MSILSKNLNKYVARKFSNCIIYSIKKFRIFISHRLCYEINFMFIWHITANVRSTRINPCFNYYYYSEHIFYHINSFIFNALFRL